MIYRRQRKQYIFAGFLAVIALVNVLFFFILNRPARTEYESLEKSIKQLRLQAGANKRNVTSLEKAKTDLDRFEKDKRSLEMMHLVHRPMGYSHIVSTLDGLVARAGLKKTRVNFNTDMKTAHAGLNSVSMTVPLEGNYSNIVSFIREVENSETFFLITAISLESSARQSGQVSNVMANNSNSGVAGSVGLSLAMETYFYQ
jgi:Tfp pilus assembly protein PilO